MNKNDDLEFALKEYFHKEEKSGISGSAAIMKRIRIYETDKSRKHLRLMGVFSAAVLILSGLTCVAAEYFIALYPGWFAMLRIPELIIRISLFAFMGIELVTFVFFLVREFMDSIRVLNDV